MQAPFLAEAWELWSYTSYHINSEWVDKTSLPFVQTFVCTYICSLCTYISVQKKFFGGLFILSEIGYIGKSDACCAMVYQGQGQNHKTLEVQNSSIFKVYFLCRLQWKLANDEWFL